MAQEGGHLKTEPEHKGSIWKHPYLVYVLLTMFLFGFLVLMAVLAWKYQWIPSRGI